MTPRLILGDCVEAMRQLDACSVDAVVTDPPYGINFMGKAWDGRAIEDEANRLRDGDSERLAEGRRNVRSDNGKPFEGSAYAGSASVAGSYDVSLRGNRAFQEWTAAWAAEALRVLKPGGYALVFGGTRTYHRLASGLEDAGFEIRDCLAWLFGSGFPKSLDAAKAIDKKLGATGGYGEPRTAAHADWIERGSRMRGTEGDPGWQRPWMDDAEAVDRAAREYLPATEEAQARKGWGTALKPAFEPIVLARKPLIGTVAANVLEYGTGALNIDGCRVTVTDDGYARNHSGDRGHAGTRSVEDEGATDLHTGGGSASDLGRWPANVILDDESAAILDLQTGELVSGDENVRRESGGDRAGNRSAAFGNESRPAGSEMISYGDRGGASRFFYCAKVSRAERNAGLDDGFEKRPLNWSSGEQNPGSFQSEGTERAARNSHPTVKPIDLMRWLIRLVVPPGGVLLDPFGGSGSTGCAAELEGVGYVLVEREPDYMRIIEARTAFWREHGEDGLRVVRERDAGQRAREAVAESGQLDLLSL